MNTTDIGRLGEAKVIARLVELGWFPFTDISGKCPVDLLAYKDGRTASFQVKTTTNDTVQLRRIRNNTSGTTVHKFDNNVADWLAVYIVEWDEVQFHPCKGITQTATMKLTNGRSANGVVSGLENQ